MLLRNWRTVNQKTLRWTAIRLGVTHAHLSRVERGEGDPSLELIAKAHVLTDGDVTANDWLQSYMQNRSPELPAVAA